MLDPQRTPTLEDEAPSKRFQFGLRAMLIAVACLAILLATGGLFGVFAVCLVGGLGCCVASLIFRRFWLDCLVLASICFVIAALLLPAMQGPRNSPHAHCRNNLKQLALALQAYHDHYGCYPPAYVADAQGRPMHSWRVFLLPYLERNDLLQRYRFDEPWDGPHNRLLHGERLSILQCPSRPDQSRKSRSTVDYLAVVGPGTAWPGGEAFRAASITDDAAETILLVEVADSDVIWCEPRDLHISQMSPRINPPAGQGISSHHHEKAQVLMADGSVTSLPVSTTPETLRALLTPSGGETIDTSWLY